MDEATAQHLAIIRAKRDKLQAEIDRIEAEWADPLKARADRAGKEWDEMVERHRRRVGHCVGCDRVCASAGGLKNHQRNCWPFKHWWNAWMQWIDNGRQGPAPKQPFPDAS